MSNSTNPERECRRFWEETLHVPMILPSEVAPEKIRQQLPMPNRDIIAERTDTLTLKFDSDSEITVPMYTEAWMRSLDYLLYRYLTLVLHDPHYSATIRVPVEVRQKYQSYKVKWKKRQLVDDQIIVPDFYKNPHNGFVDVDAGGEEFETFKTDNPVAPAIFNVFCHGLFPKANDKETRWNPHVNSQLYKLEGCGNDTIPAFKPEDYIAYELMTGLSLSVEITAVLLEIDQEIRDFAFYWFCEYALEDLVRIPFLYARATAARNFFLQVNLDWTKAKYQLFPPQSTEAIMQIIEQSALKALSCIYTLTSTPLHPQTPPLYPYGIVCEQDGDLNAILRKLEDDPDYKHVAKALRKTENNPNAPQEYIIYPISEKPGQFQIESYMFPHFQISFPRTDDLNIIEAYKKQILKNLEAVVSPLDSKKLSEPKPKNLAIFTNPNHEFVTMLMKYVEDESLQTRSLKNPPPVKSKKCIDLFHIVFAIVRLASIEAHQDIYQVKRFLTQM